MNRFFVTIDYRTPGGNLGSQNLVVVAASFEQAATIAQRRARVQRPGYRIDRLHSSIIQNEKETAA